MLRALICSAFALAACAAPQLLAADETYTIKAYKSKKGDKSEHEKTEDGKNTIAINVMGMNMKQEVASAKKEIYVEEILEKKDGDKKATKLTRTYSAAEKTDMGETKKMVYAGETVTIEKKGDKYTFSVKDKALSEDDAADLDKSFNKKADEPETEDFFPTEPIKVGGGWKVPADKAEKLFKTLGEDKLKVDTKKSTVAGKLLKAYKKDGAQFGVIELTITVFIAELDLGGEFAKTKDGSKMVIVGTVDTCIDGTIEYEDGKIEVSIDLTAGLPNGGSFNLTGKSTGVDKSMAVKK